MGKSRESANLVSDYNIFVDVSNDRVGIGSTRPRVKLDVVGVVSATSFSGSGANLTGVTASYATTATNAQGLTGTPNITVGIITATNVVIGGATTALVVTGNARITGILTIGTSSIVFDGTSNTINVGSGTTISSTGITGSGAGLTALNASNITTGIVSTARFDSNSNAFGLRTVSTSDPTGGNDGDIWYKV